MASDNGVETRPALERKRKHTASVTSGGPALPKNMRLTTNQLLAIQPAPPPSQPSASHAERAVDAGFDLPHEALQGPPRGDDDSDVEMNLDDGHVGNASDDDDADDERDAPEGARIYIQAMKRPRLSTRTRAQRNVAHQRQWDELMPFLVDTFLELQRRLEAGEGLDIDDDEPGSHTFTIATCELYEPGLYKTFVRKSANEHAVVTLMRYGYIACTPAEPAFAFGVKGLELYHQLRRLQPRLGYQAYARALASVVNAPYRPELSRQLGDAFDVYLHVLRTVDHAVNVFLGRDTPNWRLKHACPCCFYKVEDELVLAVSRQWTMDGNGSLMRYENAGKADTRVFHSDYLIPRATVDAYEDPARAEARARAKGKKKALVTGAEPGDGADGANGTDGVQEPLPCVSSWKNLQPEHIKRALPYYEQTGAFVAACRHAMILKWAEMVRSGELAKYPLAVTAEMLALEDIRQMPGYDIWCGFAITLANSPLGARARELLLSGCVGIFHGHAHNRLCQVSGWLPSLRTGAGLEDFETCERIFFESNNVARLVRYATPFHYHQFLDLHWRQWDKTRYEELSRWLSKKYVYARKVEAECNAVLAQKPADISSDDFDRWLVEEREYLQGLLNEPAEQRNDVGYVEALLDLRERVRAFSQTTQSWQTTTPSLFAGATPDQLEERRKAEFAQEKARRDALEKYKLAVDNVQAFETRLGMTSKDRWTPEHPKWAQTLEYLHKRQYLLALDKLERLIVQRLFELTKANMSGVCYKMRQHIAKALKARSRAIRTALDQFNTAARKVDPTATPLLWEDVVNWTELQDFSLLQFARQDVRERPWATHANRVLSTHHFKLLRAREEIQRIYVEVRRLRTWIDDEDRELEAAVARAEREHPLLAVAVRDHRDLRMHVNAVHRRRLTRLEAKPSYQGQKGPGEKQRVGAVNTRPAATHPPPPLSPVAPAPVAPTPNGDAVDLDPSDDGSSDESSDEERVENLAEALERWSLNNDNPPLVDD